MSAESRRISLALPILIGLVFFLCRSPFAGFHDSLSFLLDASQGFSLSTNATSHFLYNNLLHLIFLLCGPANAVTGMVLFSVLSSVAALHFFYRTAWLISRSELASACATALFAFSFSFWQQSLIIEVYAFNAFLFSAFVYFSLLSLQADKSEKLLLSSLFLGMAILTHIQNILAIPFFLLVMGMSAAGFIRKILSVLFVLLPFTVLFGLPYLLGTHPLFSVLMESRFGAQAFHFSFPSLLKGIALALGFALYNLHLGLIFTFSGLRQLYRKERRSALLLGVLALPWLAFGIQFTVPDNHVFFISVWMVALWFAAKGIAESKLNSWQWKVIPFLACALLPVLLYATSLFIAGHIPAMESYQKQKAYKGGLQHLLWPPKNHAPDPLALAKSLDEKGVPPDSVEWNYSAALQYLKSVK